MKTRALLSIDSRTLDSCRGNSFRAWVLSDRYLLPNEYTIYDLVKRLKTKLPSYLHDDADRWISSFSFVPGGRILRGLGAPEDTLTLFNCLALPAPEDNLLEEGGIIDTCHRLAESLKKGCGVGFDLSKLRPEDSPLKTSAGYASGPVSFMSLYSTIVNIVQQGGTRRGALLMSLSDSHPDIFKFINCKNNVEIVNHANLSVRMCANSLKEDVLSSVAEAAWKTGEPGILFTDNIEKDFVPARMGYPFESTNACSEIPLPAWGVCCLGSINLSNFVNSDGIFLIEDFRECVKFGVKFLNKILDLDKYPFEQSKKVSQTVRQIGLGIMGLAHAFIKKGVTYGSDESLEFCNNFMTIAKNTASLASRNLCQTKEDNIAEKIRIFEKEKSSYNHDLSSFNSTMLSGQPTGTTSIVADTSNGIEPLFALEYERNDTGTPFYVKDPVYEQYKKRRHPDIFKTAYQIPWEKRLEVQKVLQSYMDNAISSTINLPSTATPLTIKNVFERSASMGLKSVTVFRSNCYREGVLKSIDCQTGSCDV